MSGIYWLASYPKSGNTWLRIFLRNYDQNGSSPVSINTLPAGTIAYHRDLLDDWLGFETSELTDEQIDIYRPQVYEQVRGNTEFKYVKTHERFRRNSENVSVFSDSATKGVVLLVRNPFDVAVSLSKFMCISIDETIDWMGDESLTLYPQRKSISNRVAEPVGSWSGHANSWLDSNTPLLTARYEDLLSDPVTHFGRIVRFLGYPEDQKRLNKAIEHSQFSQLRQQETLLGFKELWTGAPRFFRAGEVGNWRGTLSPEQIRRLQQNHGEVIDRFHYGDRVADA